MHATLNNLSNVFDLVPVTSIILSLLKARGWPKI